MLWHMTGELWLLNSKARIVSNRGSSAFALIRDDATVLTWGEPSRGGDSSSVEDQLINVPSLASSDFQYCSFYRREF